MHVDKIALHKELVNRIGNQAADTENRLKGVGSGTQMSHGAQVLQRMTLRLDGEVGRGRAFHGNRLCLNLKGLLRIRGHLHDALDNQGSADIDLGNLREIFHCVRNDDLDRLKVRSVGEHKEAKVFGSSAVSYPTAQLYSLPRICCGVAKQFSEGK